jgi:hypothetical protein
MSSVPAHLDQVLERATDARNALLADLSAPNRAARLSATFALEAQVWSQVFELSSLRLVWRAALAAEAGARANAVLWSARAARERAGVVPALSCAAGRMGAPRPVALSTSGVRGGGR